MSSTRLGRSVCGDWEGALKREWLVTNGLGGYACGTVAGANTRRYHGFLIASLKPPVARTLLVARLEVSVDYLGCTVPLFANEFADGTVEPRGYRRLESFTVEHGIPTWRFAVADALLVQRVFMAPGANTSYLTLELERASAELRVACKALVTHRDHHGQGRGARPFTLEASAEGCTVRAVEAAGTCRLGSPEARFTAANLWYWNFRHREEAARGLDALEDLLCAGEFAAPLAPGAALSLWATAESGAPPPAAAVRESLEARAREAAAALPRDAPQWIRRLSHATLAFPVQRSGGGTPGASVIAGYPWFADWGRDTMISLPGLASALGRHTLTAEILRTYAGHVDRGMLPNRFPDDGAPAEYNTADATLWLFEALRVHLAAAPDAPLVRDLYPVLVRIVRAHVAGTRFGIAVDPADGLLRAGEPGTQVTWMDAKHGGRVFTPRIGKPVEINGLWINALALTLRLASERGDGEAQGACRGLLERASGSFARFWNARRACLYDVLDTAAGGVHDESIRPNQVLALSLPLCPLPLEQRRAALDTCARELLTSYGLRSLSPKDPAYLGRYGGDALHRDSAYHQGTVWSWLLGPFARAHARVHGDARAALALLAPMAEHLDDACVGSVSEIFDGDPPHAPRGAFAQAWGVAEILRYWVELAREANGP